MQILMLSLDKNILNKDSLVVRRMVEYGKENELFIIIPNKEKEIVDLSQTAHVQSTGGCKIQQFFRLFKIGKKLIKRNNIQEITVQDPFFVGLVGLFLKWRFQIPFEVQVHGDFLGEYYKNQWFKIKLAKFVLNKADKIRVVGERIKKSLKNLNIVKNKIEIRPIVVDAEKIKNYQAKFNLHKKYIGYGKIFLVLGRLDSVKNISWLIDIFTEVIKQKNYLLLIVGDGLEQKNLQFKVKKYNLDNNIKFEFWTNDPISYLKTADCVLFPSLSEGYGLVPMEANATGIPVIINDVGVANYELKPSERVKILKINNKEAWIKAILEV